MNHEQIDGLKVELKILVDAHGLGTILDALSEVCNDKAAHFAEYSQDTTLAKQWLKAAYALDDLADRTTL